jgi:hypothetical protein
MKKTFLLISFAIITITSFSQRSVRVREFVDTTNVTFKEIFQFWEKYQNVLQTKNYGMEVDITPYWAPSEIKRYSFPDLRYEMCDVYPLLSEYLIGIEKRNDTLYEIKSVYYSPYSKEPEIILIANIFVLSTSSGYKLMNPFTKNVEALHKKEYDWLHFYYSDDYLFNETQAEQLYQRANKFIKDLDINIKKPMHYYLCNTNTDMYDLFGLSAFDDYYSTNKVRKRGRDMHHNRMLFYTQGGENYLHEIIHILIYGLRDNFFESDFDEGVCTYFGEHVGLPFDFHAKKLKEFLNNNPQIDLGISLKGAYKDNSQRYTHAEKWKTDNGFSVYCDDSTNFFYAIMATLCEIAFKKGGMDLIKQMILEAPNPESTNRIMLYVGDELIEEIIPTKDFYSFIEDMLGIKKKKINAYIRDYLNKNY